LTRMRTNMTGKHMDRIIQVLVVDVNRLGTLKDRILE
jgi:hypothetical protein